MWGAVGAKKLQQTLCSNNAIQQRLVKSILELEDNQEKCLSSKFHMFCNFSLCFVCVQFLCWIMAKAQAAFDRSLQILQCPIVQQLDTVILCLAVGQIHYGNRKY